jgi:hypothetical protein
VSGGVASSRAARDAPGEPAIIAANGPGRLIVRSG